MVEVRAMAPKDNNFVMLGQFTAPHGVRGLMKLRSYTEMPEAVLEYGPLFDRNGAEYQITLKGNAKSGLLVSVSGVQDRDAAEKLRGIELFVPRHSLPDEDVGDDEFYQTDLINLDVVDEAGVVVGNIRAVQNFGAGDMLDVRLAAGSRTVLIPFTHAAVPEIDLAVGLVRVNNIQALIDSKSDTDNGA